MKLLAKATQNQNSTAIISRGKSFSYRELLTASAEISTLLLNQKADLNEARIAFMVSPGFDYVKTQWGIWRAGGVAVPLCISYPISSLAYVIEDTFAQTVICSQVYKNVLETYCSEKAVRLLVIEEMSVKTESSLPEISLERRAMILYTSGTTSLPKGVVSTHKNIEAQVTALIKAWQWSPSDHILCVLPLHHIHGTINVISCALWSGAVVEFLPEFSAKGVFGAFERGQLNLFMAVPTIYFKLISYYDALEPEEKARLKSCMSKFRLMVSGSAALPVSIMEKWESISGHRLLERYGMTEIGMGISNPFDGDRKAGYIGMPLPGVSARLFDENLEVLTDLTPGEIQIKGDNVFLEYWNKPEATQKAFTSDGWFKTGDVAIIENGYYKILGRDSIDIIKSGGYKLSAVEIEEVLRTHIGIEDCSVIGLPSQEWGETVAAVLVLKTESLDLLELNTWMREKLPAYKVPRQYKIVKELPRNAMGKVTKNDLKPLFN